MTTRSFTRPVGLTWLRCARSTMMILVVLCVGLVNQSQAGKPVGALAGFGASRTWSDQSGSFKVDAELAEADNTNVKLRKPDGRVVTVPLNKLSESDKAFIDAFLKAEAALGGSSSENPFAGGEMENATPSGEIPSEAASSAEGMDALPVRKAIVDSPRPMEIDFKRPFWEAAPVSPIVIPAGENQTVRLPLEKEFFAGMQLKVAGGSPTAFVNVYRQSRKTEENYCKVGGVILADGRPKAMGHSTSPWKIMAVSPDASRIAFVKIVGFDKGNDVAIFKATSEGLTPEYQFTAGGGAWDELHWVAFLDRNRLATISQKHTLTIWDLERPKAIFRGTVGNSLTGIVAGRSEALVIPSNGGVAILSGKNYEQTGLIPVDGAPSVAMSADGQKLAIYTPFSVAIHDMKDGSQLKDITVAESRQGVRIDWIGENVLLDRKLLIDVENELPLWKYEGGEGRAIWANKLYTVFAGKEAALVSLNLPHAAAKRSATSVPDDQLYALDRGALVSINMNLAGVSNEDRNGIRSAIENKIRDAGWKLSNSSRNVIHLEVKQGKQTESTYRGFFGHGGGSEKVTYRPWLQKIWITVGQETVFTRQITISSPWSINQKDNESAQQAVNRLLKPSVQFFEGMAIPKRLLSPKYRDGFGTSKITPSGLN